MNATTPIDAGRLSLARPELASRGMVASNLAAGGLVAGFAAIIGGVRETRAALPRGDRLRLFSGTAAEASRIPGHSWA